MDTHLAWYLVQGVLGRWLSAMEYREWQSALPERLLFSWTHSLNIQTVTKVNAGFHDNFQRKCAGVNEEQNALSAAVGD